MPYFVSQYSLIFLNALVLLLGQTLIKQELKSYGPISLASIEQFLSLFRYVLATPLLVLGYLLSAFSGFLWIITLSRLEMSQAVPLYSGTYYILLLLASAIIFGEAVGWAKVAGTGLIFAGIILITHAP